MYVHIVLHHSGNNKMCNHKIQHVVYQHTCLIHQVSGRLQRQYFSFSKWVPKEKWDPNSDSHFIKNCAALPHTHAHTHTHKHTHSCTSIMNIQRKNVRLHWQFFHAKSPCCSPRWDKYRHNLVALIFCLSLSVWFQSVGPYNQPFDDLCLPAAGTI